MLRYTAAMMIAAYAGWLARSLRSGAAGALLPGLLQLLTAGVLCRHPGAASDDITIIKP